MFQLDAHFSDHVENYMNIPKEGSLRVEVKFSSNLTEALKMICLMNLFKTAF